MPYDTNTYIKRLSLKSIHIDEKRNTHHIYTELNFKYCYDS